MKVLVTGSQGFLGKNLIVRLQEQKKYEVVEFRRGNSVNDLEALVQSVDIVFHLAGVNRPKDESEFKLGNCDLTEILCQALAKKTTATPVIYSSSIQAEKENPYGKSKKDAESFLENLRGQHPVYIYRLPNVFGKWSRPNYNSVVATFCYNIARGLPITINDPSVVVNLVYVDDVIAQFFTHLEQNKKGVFFPEVKPVYTVTVEALARSIETFKQGRQTLLTEAVGTGFQRALHATYLSFLSPEQFAYCVPRHADKRGVFVEMLKTKDSGQVSFFTAHPGITRGGHYHHSKTEKFLVLLGKAKYRFRHIITKEFYELDVDASESKIVETIPGWSHDITNIGTEELVVMLWANEIFDRVNPDTVGHEV